MKADFTRNLLKWNATQNSRSMPWKGERDPYKVWLSEIILQQTQVSQGRGYYEKFISAYPNIVALANASDDDIYKLWEGLGYYTRCKNLIATARIVAYTNNGIFPCSYEEILNLKGIGPYTAAAISSFAFNEKRAVVDGNVQRVMSRYFGISTPVDTPEGKKLFADLSQSLLDVDSPAKYNQALMDFGATICKPRNPVCKECVQNKDCEAFKGGFTNELPVKIKLTKKTTRWLYYFMIENNDCVYIRKRQGKDIWQNLHEFVLFESGDEQSQAVKLFLDKLLQHQTYTIVHSSEIQTQQLTHQRIMGRFFKIRLNNSSPVLDNYSLVSKSNLHAYAFPRFINSFLEKNLH